ncbi:MAG: hypothetical protein IKV86_00175, partial [Clostridia bacterium]|nr:hypothetical protein [Clostridia bacterium]
MNVKNGGKLTNVYADGTEIFANNEGVYTIANASVNTKITAKTDRDEFSPIGKIWNSKDLSKKSAAYNSSIWDETQIFETAYFYDVEQSAGVVSADLERGKTIKLLYPIDEIIAVQSYDL